MTARHDFIPTHLRMNPRQRSTSEEVTVRGIFSARPGPGSLRREGEASASAPFPLPGPDPLGRRTLDVRASIMLAPIIIIYFEMSTVFSVFFRSSRPNSPETGGSRALTPLFSPAESAASLRTLPIPELRPFSIAGQNAEFRKSV